MRPKKYRKSSNSVENRMVNALDQLAAFEQFKEEILPALRKDIESGLEAKDIIKKYRAIAAARMVTSMFMPMPPTAQAAAKDILDRGDGKATEQKKITVKYEDVADDDLDALLASKLGSDEE